MKLFRKKEQINVCNKEYRICHYEELFVRSDGKMFPCCLVNGGNDMVIADIRDAGVREKMRKFYHKCSCDCYVLKKANDADKAPQIKLLNIEMSLLCQGKCAMCCVGSPDWRGEYHLYDDLSRLIAKFRPAELRVQGGEVLIQQETLEWLSSVKTDYPLMNLSIVTNGNVDEKKTELALKFFDKFIVSVVGFQSKTYEAIMGMNFNQMEKFVRRISDERNADLRLKYLVTPLGVHEASSFLNWAVLMSPVEIIFQDSRTTGYLNMATHDSYWKKIITRAGNDLRKAIAFQKKVLEQHNVKISFDTRLLGLYGITDRYVQSEALSDIVKWGKLAGGEIMHAPVSDSVN